MVVVVNVCVLVLVLVPLFLEASARAGGVAG